jgi:hypothetical protein
MASSDNRYDFWVNGLGFNTYISKDHPYVRQTADYRKEQINQAAGVGDTALTGWWTEGQLSFHGGAGLRYDTEWNPQTNIRFDVGAAIDAYRAGELRVGYGLAPIANTPNAAYNSFATETGTGLVVAQSIPGTVDVIHNDTSSVTYSAFPSGGGARAELARCGRGRISLPLHPGHNRAMLATAEPGADWVPGRESVAPGKLSHRPLFV